MALLMTDPFSSLLRFQELLDTLRDSAWLDSGPSARGTYPPVNVFRKGDDIVLVAEVPGIRKDDLRIEMKGRTVRLAGDKTLARDKEASLHRRERLQGSFDRALTLPVEIDADQVKAECHDGILVLWLPRAERDRPKTIRVS